MATAALVAVFVSGNINPRDLAEWIVLAAAVVASITALGKAWERLSMHLAQRRRDLLEILLLQMLQPVLSEMATVEERTRQLVPNGGESVADKVTRIENALLFHTEYSAQDRAELHRIADEAVRRIEALEEQ